MSKIFKSLKFDIKFCGKNGNSFFNSKKEVSTLGQSRAHSGWVGGLGRSRNGAEVSRGLKINLWMNIFVQAGKYLLFEIHKEVVSWGRGYDQIENHQYWENA